MVIKQRKLKKIDDEVWKVIPNSNDRYQVSNYGRVKSYAYDKENGKILKCFESKGFKIIPLNINKVSRKIYVHKLVAEIWIPRPSEQHTFVTHLDRNVKNNHVLNLVWMTKETLDEHNREFYKQKIKQANYRKIITHSKLKEMDIIQLKSMLQKGVTQTAIAKMFCISEMQVTRIKRGENWGHIQI